MLHIPTRLFALTVTGAIVLAAHPALAAAAPPAKGPPALTKEQIGSVLREHSKQVRRCYDEAAKGDRKLGGQLGVEIAIGASGRVSRARVLYSTVGKPAVDGCVVHGIRSWVFPKPQGGREVVFVYPLVFQQKGGRPAVPKQLSREMVSQGMRAVLDQVRGCIQRFKVAGTAKVRTTIGQDGLVSAAKLEGEPFAGTEAGACIEAAVAAARFPRFTGAPISFSYPYVLR